MGYTNSPLVAYTKLSPNHSGQRTHKIDRISPHCVVGQCSAEGLGDWFYKSSTRASSNYGIDKDGRVGMYVEEKNRSWCTSSNENDQRAVTIECASGKVEPYAMNEVVYDRLIDLCVDICQRNGKKKLLWFGDKQKSLSYQPKEDEMLITVHRWFANKSCPGNWLYVRLGDLATTKVTARLSGGESEAIPSGMQAREFQNLTEAQVIAKVGALFTADQKKSGILASVSMAQFFLESGYGKSELAQGANNCFGMKKSLSGNKAEYLTVEEGLCVQIMHHGPFDDEPATVAIMNQYMMNTADRSLAMLDYALRRRFAFFDLKPGFTTEGFRTYRDGLDNKKFEALVGCVQSLNEKITADEALGEGF